MSEENLTDNLWVQRVSELGQMISDLPSAPDTIYDVAFYLESEEFFGSENFSTEDRRFLEKEMIQHYNVL